MRRVKRVLRCPFRGYRLFFATDCYDYRIHPRDGNALRGRRKRRRGGGKQCDSDGGTVRVRGVLRKERCSRVRNLFCSEHDDHDRAGD